MYTIKLMNEYLHGPIWVYDEYGEEGVPKSQRSEIGSRENFRNGTPAPNHIMPFSNRFVLCSIY